MTTVVIMPGGFHPFHAGHLALYQSAQRAFPDAEVFVAATNDTSARPFPFAVKEKLAKLAGVEAGHFVQVKSPFRAEEITSKFDPNKDTVIFVRSDKDATKPPQGGGIKKDGTPAYLQPLLGAKRLEPFAKHAYMAYLPTVEFGPGFTSATEIRGAWPTLNDKRKTALVMSLYPQTQGNTKLAQTVVKLLDAAIVGQEVAEGDLQEIQRTKGDEEGLSTKGQNWGKETLSKIKMLPGSQRFGYTAGGAGRAGAFLTGADTIIELFDVKHPKDGLRKAGFLALRSAPWFPIKNSYQVANVGVDDEYRGQGLAQNIYGVAMKLLGMTIVADDSQTPQARSSWLRLSQVPGVAINGYTSVFSNEWAKRNNRNEIYDDSAKRLISSLLKAGGQEIGKNSNFVYVSFPVGANADQNELQALQKGMAIYSSRHPEDGGTENGLYARWGGPVREQGMAEAINPMTANTSGAGAGMMASYQARENQPVAERHIQDYIEEARS